MFRINEKQRCEKIFDSTYCIIVIQRALHIHLVHLYIPHFIHSHCFSEFIHCPKNIIQHK
jgi:hypothetical protein